MKNRGKTAIAYLLFSLFLAGLVLSCDITTDSETWAKAYSRPGERTSAAMPVQLKDGNFILLEGDSILKLDSTGAIVWHKKVSANYNCFAANTIDETPDGGILVSKRLYDPDITQNNALMLFKIDGNAAPLWQRLYYSASNVYYENWPAVSVDSATGEIYATGIFDFKRHVRKIDENGTLLWTKRISTGEDYDSTSIIKALPGGGCVIGNSIIGAVCMITRLDADGAILWQKSYSISGVPDYPEFTENDVVYSIDATAEGGYILLGSKEYTPWVMKIDASGNKVWVKMLTGIITEKKHPAMLTDKVMRIAGKSIYQTDDGGYALAGQSSYYRTYRITPFNYVEFEDHAAWIIKLKADGSISWQKAYRDKQTSKTYQAENDDEFGNALVMQYWNTIQISSMYPCKNKGFIAAGTTEFYGSGKRNALVFATDKNGKISGTALKISTLAATASAIDCDIVDMGEESVDVETEAEDFIMTVITPGALEVTDI